MAMQIQAELCHVDTLRCVVRVEGWDGERRLGSALGEDQTCEAAEDRAIRRLMARLGQEQSSQADADERQPARRGSQTKRAQTDGNQTEGDQTQRTEPELGQEVLAEPVAVASAPLPQSAPESQTAPSVPSVVRAAQAPSRPLTDESDPPSEAPTDPEDWSEELTAIDFELRRIGWDRSRERIYLERAFGHGSRHRLTRYADLVAFLRQLRQIQPEETPETAAVPIRRSDLIQQGDQMLHQLQWSKDQAREFLQKHQRANSRQQLSDEQLLQFNILLEDQLNANAH